MPTACSSHCFRFRVTSVTCHLVPFGWSALPSTVLTRLRAAGLLSDAAAGLLQPPKKSPASVLHFQCSSHCTAWPSGALPATEAPSQHIAAGVMLIRTATKEEPFPKRSRDSANQPSQPSPHPPNLQEYGTVAVKQKHCFFCGVNAFHAFEEEASFRPAEKLFHGAIQFPQGCSISFDARALVHTVQSLTETEKHIHRGYM